MWLLTYWQAKESEHVGVTGVLSPSKSAVGAMSSSSTPLSGNIPIRGDEVAAPEDGSSPFNYRAPMDNIVIRTYQFPMR